MSALPHTSPAQHSAAAQRPRPCRVGIRVAANHRVEGEARARHRSAGGREAQQVSVALDRRQLLTAAAVAALLPGLDRPAAAEEAASTSSAAGDKVYFDVKIDGEPAGRIVIELFSDVPAGSGRFRDLTVGKEGVGYRLSKFNGIFPTYIRNDGLNRLSYSATEQSPILGGDSLVQLEDELSKQSRSHSVAGLVSLTVLEKEERPIKEKLVAYGGKFITVKQQAGEAPNGTEYAITTAAEPDLDRTNLIIGKVVDGWELVQRISALPINKPRNDNPYFVAGKAMGDKRAVTAERAFNRPFSKVVVSGGGLVQ